MACNQDHRYNIMYNTLPEDQGGSGRHKFAGCAYDAGFQLGLLRQENLSMNLNSLPVSQAGTVRHRSPHTAFAQGYLDGVRESYN